MALIKCNECGKEISDTLNTCPNCGIELKKSSSNNTNNSINNKNKYNLIIIIILSLYSLIFLVYIFEALPSIVREPNIKDILSIFYYIVHLTIFWLLYFYNKTKNNILAKTSFQCLITLIIILFIYDILNFDINYLKYNLIEYIDKLSIPTIFYLIITKLNGGNNGSN